MDPQRCGALSNIPSCINPVISRDACGSSAVWCLVKHSLLHQSSHFEGCLWILSGVVPCQTFPPASIQSFRGMLVDPQRCGALSNIPSCINPVISRDACGSSVVRCLVKHSLLHQSSHFEGCLWILSGVVPCQTFPPASIQSFRGMLVDPQRCGALSNIPSCINPVILRDACGSSTVRCLVKHSLLHQSSHFEGCLWILSGAVPCQTFPPASIQSFRGMLVDPQWCGALSNIPSCINPVISRDACGSSVVRCLVKHSFLHQSSHFEGCLWILSGVVPCQTFPPASIQSFRGMLVDPQRCGALSNIPSCINPGMYRYTYITYISTAYISVLHTHNRLLCCVCLVQYTSYSMLYLYS